MPFWICAHPFLGCVFYGDQSSVFTLYLREIKRLIFIFISDIVLAHLDYYSKIELY